jgi:hypothetical protein
MPRIPVNTEMNPDSYQLGMDMAQQFNNVIFSFVLFAAVRIIVSLMG